jgi:hypothetical protein
MRNCKILWLGVCLLAIAALSSCSSSGSGGTPQQDTASAFTIGTDAPLPSVVSCEITITGVTVYNGTNNVPVMTNPQIIDFAQLSGLHQLLDLNAVPTGTYTAATVTLSSPVIGYVNTGVNPPTISTINGTLSTNSVTVQFANPFVLEDNDLVGLRMEFDLGQSLQTDQNGQITGAVNPVFHMGLLAADDPNVSIDDFHAGFVGSTGPNTFVVQGPKGRQWTVETNGNTTWDDADIPVSSYTTNTILSISGQLDPVSKNIDATEIEVVSTDNFVLGGLLTSVRPPSGPATQADLYVRYELPDVNGVSDGQMETLNLTGKEIYRIGHINLPLTSLLFNNSAMAAGQSVDVGGVLTPIDGLDTLTVHRVVLRRQGQAGTLVPNSVIIQSGNQGSFGLNDDWTAGVLLPNPLPVMTTISTNFINVSGLSALQSMQSASLRVVGFILVDPSTGQPVMVASSVALLTD